MIERERVSQHAREFFDAMWRKGDPWDIEGAELTAREHDRLIALLEGRRYRRVLEIGCGAGVFTRRLSTIADSVVALDVAPAAIERAQAMNAGPATVEFRVANIMDTDPNIGGPWDLVVMAEMIYLLGWLYPFFDIAWLASQLFSATAEGGRLLLANTTYGMEHPLLLPWVIHTYHDLFRNVGYRTESEETLRGVKDGVELEILISRFVKPGGPR
jgi:SAM-dependent methyltransferase